LNQDRNLAFEPYDRIAVLEYEVQDTIARRLDAVTVGLSKLREKQKVELEIRKNWSPSTSKNFKEVSSFRPVTILQDGQIVS